jgi:gliding motility-associated-like protein
VPVITCPPNISQNAGAGLCTAFVAVTNATISDNCSVTSLIWTMTGATVAVSPAAGINQVGTYTFNPGITTITYTVKDGSGNQAICGFTVTITVTDIQNPTITCPGDIIQNTNTTGCAANVVVPIPVTADNCGVASVTNSFNGTANASGTYPIGVTTVIWTVTDINGNTATCSHTVTVISTLVPVLTSSDADNTICLGENVTFTGSGGVTYEFLLNGTSVQGPGTNNTYTTSSIVDQDKIIVRVTDAMGCNGSSPEITTKVNPLPSGSITSQTDVLCFGDATGSFDLTPAGGTSPYTFLWGNGVTTEDIINLSAGLYTVLITDLNGCTAIVSGTINEPASAVSGIITAQTNVTVHGGNDGSVTVEGSGGIGPYLYSFEGGTFQTPGIFSSLTAGSYIVTVRDANLCTSDVPVTITQPSLPLDGTITSQTNVLCFGAATGSVTVTGVEGVIPYLYSINGGPYQPSGTFISLAAGSYTVTIKDAISDTFDVLFIITQPATAFTVTTTQTNVLCYGGSSGSATASAAGGTLPYNYSWNTIPVQPIPDATGLTVGSYTVTVTDANGCIATANIAITEPALLAVEATPAEAKCPDSNDGSITLSIAGGTAPYSMIWNDRITTRNRPSVLPGAYRVDVTDANGCQASANTVVGFTGSFGCVVIPQIITPNGDLYNDEWVIRNIDLYPNAEVRIFTRWGKMIFKTKNILANPWKGTYSDGKLVPTDSYHYILYLNDGSEPRSGVISVIR